MAPRGPDRPAAPCVGTGLFSWLAWTAAGASATVLLLHAGSVLRHPPAPAATVRPVTETVLELGTSRVRSLRQEAIRKALAAGRRTYEFEVTGVLPVPSTANR